MYVFLISVKVFEAIIQEKGLFEKYHEEETFIAICKIVISMDS